MFFSCWLLALSYYYFSLGFAHHIYRTMLANTRVRPSLKELRGDSAKTKYRAASSIFKRVNVAGRIVAPCYALLEERQREVRNQQYCDGVLSVAPIAIFIAQYASKN